MDKRPRNFLHKRDSAVNGKASIGSYAIKFSLKKPNSFPSRHAAEATLPSTPAVRVKGEITPHSLFARCSPSDSDGEEKAVVVNKEEHSCPAEQAPMQLQMDAPVVTLPQPLPVPVQVLPVDKPALPLPKVSFTMSKKSVSIAPLKKNGLPDAVKRGECGMKRDWIEEEEEHHMKTSKILPPTSDLRSSGRNAVAANQENNIMNAAYSSFLQDISLGCDAAYSCDEMKVEDHVSTANEFAAAAGNSSMDNAIKKEAVMDSNLDNIKMEELDKLDIDCPPVLSTTTPTELQPQQRSSTPIENPTSISRPTSRMQLLNSPQRTKPRRSPSSPGYSRRQSRSPTRSRSPSRHRHVMTSSHDHRRSPSPYRKRQRQPSSPSPTRQFFSNITKKMHLQQQPKRSLSKERKSIEQRSRKHSGSSPDHHHHHHRHSRSKRHSRSRSRSPPRGVRSRDATVSPSRGCSGQQHRSHGSNDRDEGIREQRKRGKDTAVKASVCSNDSSATTSPEEETLGNDQTKPDSNSRKRNGFSERFVKTGQLAPSREINPDDIFASRFAQNTRQFPSNIRPISIAEVKEAATVSSMQEGEFPPVTEPTLGSFPVAFNFEGTGPVFCWPYYMPDGYILLAPYLGLQKAPTADSIQHYMAVSVWAEPPPLLISGCPADYTPFNLNAIPTYDPTRAIPPPPPSATAPVNQPTKPAVQKLIRIQQKERERLKRQRAEKEKLALAVIDTPTPTSESLSSKTTTSTPTAPPLLSGDSTGCTLDTKVTVMATNALDKATFPSQEVI